jgi:hypothetical protein
MSRNPAPLLSAAEAALVVELLRGHEDDLTDGELTDAVLAADRMRSRLEAVSARLVARWDARQVWAGDGARSGAAWLAARSELSRSAARSHVEMARDLRDCPVLAEAFDHGTIGAAKVRRALKVRTGHEDLFAEHEAQLVELLTPLKVDEALATLTHWRSLADDTAKDDADPDDVPESANTVHLSRTLEGRWDLHADLDPITGTRLANALDAHVDAEFRAGRFTKDDGLLLAQRRAQGFAALLDRGDTPGSSHGGVRHAATIVTDIASLRGDPVDDLRQLGERRCRLADGTTIPRSTAERILCEADITELLVQLGLDGTHTPVATSHTLRRATAAQFRALVERDRHCVYPGCDQPAERCEGHHVPTWETTGHTTTDEMALLCRFHHHLVHEGGHHLARDPASGTITVTRPDGTIITTAPPGQQPLDPDLLARPGQPPPGRTPTGGTPTGGTPTGGTPTEPVPIPTRPPRTRFRPLARRTPVGPPPSVLALDLSEHSRYDDETGDRSDEVLELDHRIRARLRAIVAGTEPSVT